MDRTCVLTTYLTHLTHLTHLPYLTYLPYLPCCLLIGLGVFGVDHFRILDV
jgi:hypothetical protein